MKIDFKEWIEAHSLRIRAGEGHAVRVELQDLVKKNRVPRRFLADMAQLAWRANLPHIALKLLHPVVHPSGRNYEVATEKEKAEYAVALIKEGAVHEGIQLLHGLPKKEYPTALLYEAFGLIACWDYAATIPLLIQYRALPELTVYQRLVSDVNLIAAYIFLGDHTNAAKLLGEALEKATGPHFSLARARLLELKAESLIAQGDYASAEAMLTEASAALSDEGAIDHFFIRKYQAVIAFFKTEGPDAVKCLEAVRAEALQRRHWETLRDLERVTAIKLKDAKRFSHVYFGCPHECFRGTLLKHKPAEFELPKHFEWAPFAQTELAPVLDLTAGTWKGRKLSQFREGMGNRRLLNALCSDFYRPFRIASLFAAAFPQERYIPVHSSVRVRKALSRLRQWLEENQIPLEVRVENDEYRIAASAPVRVRLGQETKARTRPSEMLERLKELLSAEKPFSSVEASQLLGLSQRSVQRLLGEGEIQSHLEKVGQGKRTLYRFAA